MNFKNILNIIVLITFSIIAIAITLYTSNPLFHILFFWLLIIATVIISNFNLLHPYFWFSVFFGLYTSSYAITILQGSNLNIGYSYENILLSIIALTVTILIVGPKQNKIEQLNSDKKFRYDIDINLKLLKSLLIIILITIIICVIIISRLGIEKKTLFISNRYFSFRLAAYLVRYITLYVCLYIVASKKEEKIKKIIILCGAGVLLFSMFTAERDAIFRFAMVVVLSMLATGKLSRKSLPLIGLFTMVMVILASSLKYYFVSGIKHSAIKNNSVLYTFLNSNFSMVGHNMQVLLNNPWTKSSQSYSIILTDLLSPFILGLKAFNTASWFNESFFYGKYSRAFTLLGQGYIIGGYFGVIILFLVLGIIIKTLYNKSKINVYWLTGYIYAIATISSSFRGTLGSIVNEMVRIPLLGLAAYIIFESLIIRHNEKN